MNLNTLDFDSKKPIFKNSSEEEIYENAIYFLDSLNTFDIETSKNFAKVEGIAFFATIEEIIKEWKRWEKEFESPKDTKKIGIKIIKERVEKFFPKSQASHTYLLAEDFSKGTKTYGELAKIKSDFLRKKSQGLEMNKLWYM